MSMSEFGSEGGYNVYGIPSEEIEDATSPERDAVDADAFYSTGITPDVADNPFAAHEERDIDKGEVAPMPPIDTFEAIAAIKRAAILEQIGEQHDPEGVNVGRVNDFFEALGFAETGGAQLIVPADDLPRVETIIGAVSDDHPVSPYGAYYPDVNLTVIPKLHDPRIIEDMLTWFKTFSTCGASESMKAGDLTGIFLQVGFAQWLEAEYAAHTQLHDKARPKPYTPPYHRLIPDPPEKYRLAHANNYAAMVWDVLFDAQPDLLPQIINTHVGDDQFRSVAGLIDAIRPGLYDELATMPWIGRTADGEIGFQTLQQVLDDTGLQMCDLNRVCSQGAGAHYVAERLKIFAEQTGRQVTVPQSDMPQLDRFDISHPRFSAKRLLNLRRRPIEEGRWTESIRLRDEVMERAAHLHDAAAVDVVATEHFMQALGIAPFGDTIVARRHDRTALEAILASVTESNELIGLNGKYLGAVGLSVVILNPRAGILPEATYLHERTHSRCRLYSVGIGHYLEEGLAHLVGNTYARLSGVQPDRWRSRLSSLGRMLPDRYGRATAYDFAAATVELLAFHEPQIFDILAKPLSSDEGVEHLRRLVDGVRPGLYGYLAGTPEPIGGSLKNFVNSAMIYRERLQTVVRALGIGLLTPRHPAWGNDMMPLLADKLAAYEQATGSIFNRIT